MKKTFQLHDTKKAPERIVEAIKNELRKYIKRERAKKGKEESKLFWRTECRFGKSADSAQSVEFETLIKQLDTVVPQQWTECFVEVIVSVEPREEKKQPTTEA
jgi:Family of unknown function (DUF6172)